MPPDSGRRRVAHATFQPRSLYLALAVGSGWAMGPVSAQPANDLFANRIVKTGTSWTESGTTAGATVESGEPTHFNGGTGRSVWWTWTSPESGVVSLDTFPSSNYSAVGVYQGTSVSDLVLVTNGVSYSYPNGASRVNFEAVAGATNRVRVHNLTCTTEPGEPVPLGVASFRSSWWSWTAPADGLATVDTQARGFSTRVTVYTGEVLSSLTRVASASFAERTSGSCTFMATHGVTYIIGVDAPNLGSGVIDFTLRQPSGAPEIIVAPANVLVGRADPAELSAAIGGMPPIAFQWFLGDQPIAGETNTTLQIAAALESHIGAYHLRASNALGSIITPPATLAIATNWIEFVPGTLTVLEGNRTSFNVRRSGFTNALTVRLTFGGSAIPGADFSPLPPTLNFAGGQTNITLTYQTFDDPDEEPARTLEISLAASAHYSAVNSMVIRQQDDDPNIRLSVDPGFARRFHPEPGRVLFRRTGNLDRTLTVPFGVAGSARPGTDFDLPSSPVVFPPGQAVVVLPILAMPGAAPPIDRWSSPRNPMRARPTSSASPRPGSISSPTARPGYD